jgi:hypothetical protein
MRCHGKHAQGHAVLGSSLLAWECASKHFCVKGSNLYACGLSASVLRRLLVRRLPIPVCLPCALVGLAQVLDSGLQGLAGS